MDFGNAALLIAVVFGLTEFAKTLLDLKGRWTVVAALAIGQAAVFLVGATVWAHEQVVGNHGLDSLDFWSKVLVGFLLAGAAVIPAEGLRALRNVGENEPPG